MEKVHVLTVSTALALGYAAGFASDGIIAQAAVEQKLSHTVSGPVAGPALSCFANCATTYICPVVNTELGFTGGDVCQASDFNFVGIEKQGSGYVGVGTVDITGTWVRGSP